MITLIPIDVARAVAEIVETVVEFLQTPAAVPVVSPIVVFAAAPPPLPTLGREKCWLKVFGEVGGG